MRPIFQVPSDLSKSAVKFCKIREQSLEGEKGSFALENQIDPGLLAISYIFKIR